MGKYGRYGYTMDLQSLRMLGRHRRRRPRRPRMGTRTGSPELKVYAQTRARHWAVWVVRSRRPWTRPTGAPVTHDP